MRAGLSTLVASAALAGLAGHATGQRDGRPRIPAADAAPRSFVRSVDWHGADTAGLAASRAPHTANGPSGPSSLASGQEPVLIAHTVFAEPGAPWLRLHFRSHDLGNESYVRLRSLADGAVQVLHGPSLAAWYDYSAFFNGDAIELELYAAPGDEVVFVEVDVLLAGIADATTDATGGSSSPGGGGEAGGLDTLCDADNRVASTDPRIGRVRRTDGVVFCSPWLASNGAVLLAGHCLDNDGNGTNELLTAGSVIEFDPPPSSSSGAPGMSAPEDQYPVDMSRLAWPTTGINIGADWAVIGLNPNTLNGDEAHTTRGFFRMTSAIPSPGTITRITGCGDDVTPPGSAGGANAESQTLQTSTGRLLRAQGTSFRNWYEYEVDTTNNSSGSPVIWNSFDLTIGIHTNGGCSESSGNLGVSFRHDPLEDALEDFVAPGALFVDGGMPPLATESGSPLSPFDTLDEALAAAAPGGTIGVVAGTYSVTGRGSYLLQDPALLVAPSGPALFD